MSATSPPIATPPAAPAAEDQRLVPISRLTRTLRRPELGSFLESETSIEELTSMMAGGGELEELSHELQRATDPQTKEVAKELAAEAQKPV